MKYLRGVYLVARREYLAYVGAWGFWISLVSTPLLLAMVIFLPVALRQAEPTRYIAVLADNAEEGRAVSDAFTQDARDDVRAALYVFAQRAAPAAADEALRAFDAQSDPDAAIEAARAVIDRAAPGAGVRFKPPAARYQIVLAPAPDIEGLKPYLRGAQRIGDEPLFGAFVVHGAGADTRLDYWSANLTDEAPAARARAALAERMQRAALKAHGLAPGEAARIQELSPAFAQFDPRPRAAGAAVTSGDRAPFVVAIGLALLLWSSVIGVANMLLSGVIEEKSNKILDALMTSISPLQILSGKLIGVAGVSATLFGVWGVLGAIGLTQASRLADGSFFGALAQAALDPGLLATFLICFAAGYLMFGALFLGIGSLCESLQESQTLLGPIFLVMVGPVLLLGPAFENPKSPLIAAASWAPPFTPFLMLMRAPAGLSFAETIGPVLLLIATLAAILVISARVFRAGVSGQLKIGDLFRRRTAS
jgi:ABC-2 type transport system permease protein